MKNNENKNGNQEKEFANPWRKSLPPLPQKTKFRRLSRAILILLAFLFLAIAIPRLYSEISFRWQYRDLIAQEKAFQRDYVKYSGKTPQEVYEKYVSVLKRGDIEEASKYYSTPEAVVKRKKFFEDLIGGNNKKLSWEEYINNLPKWGELEEESHWDKNMKIFVHKYELEQDRVEYDEWLKQEYVRPAGIYNDYRFDFFYDSSKKLWKLYD